MESLGEGWGGLDVWDRHGAELDDLFLVECFWSKVSLAVTSLSRLYFDFSFGEFLLGIEHDDVC